MNKQRRKSIQEIIESLSDLEALKSELQEHIEELRDEEQEYLDNFPENMQSSDRYYAVEEAVSNLYEAARALDDCDVDSIRSYLESAAE